MESQSKTQFSEGITGFPLKEITYSSENSTESYTNKLNPHKVNKRVDKIVLLLPYHKISECFLGTHEKQAHNYCIFKRNGVII